MKEAIAQNSLCIFSVFDSFNIGWRFLGYARNDNNATCLGDSSTTLGMTSIELGMTSIELGMTSSVNSHPPGRRQTWTFQGRDSLGGADKDHTAGHGGNKLLTYSVAPDAREPLP